jgi:hypothetical protein
MRTCSFATLAGIVTAFTVTAAVADIVRPASDTIDALPGSQVSVLWMIETSTAPLFGYSLDLNLLADVSGTRTGSTVINTDASNFFDQKNLITAGGGTRDQIFSVMLGDGSGGAFISTNSNDGSVFMAEAGVNDVLAEIVFDISADASGVFVFDLGPGSALSDANGFPVDFTGIGLELNVVPSPGALSLPCVAFLAARRRRD